MNESRILDAIDARRDELVGLAQTLLRRPSENPPGGEREVAEALKQVIEQYSLGDMITIASDPERPSVITTLKGQGPGKKLIYNGHTDVVPVGEDERALWRADPYGAEIIDGELYGRGAADMKGPIAAMLYGAIAIKETGAPFNGELSWPSPPTKRTADTTAPSTWPSKGWRRPTPASSVSPLEWSRASTSWLPPAGARSASR